MTSDPATPYFLTGPWIEVAYLDGTEFPTVVNVARDHPMSEMATLFDATFGTLFPILDAQGIHPAGPPFSLHRRTPTDTADFEVGIPVDRPLEGGLTMDSGVTLVPSVLPAGRIAIISHIGPYDDLAEAWGAFMGTVAAAGHQVELPFWEIYVTEPTPDIDPATLRTDLVTPIRS